MPCPRAAATHRKQKRRGKIANQSDDTQSRLERASAALIRYPRFKELHRDIRQCQQLSKIAGEPQCMSLEGVTGAGKSTLIRDYAAAFPRCDTPEGTRVPVFYVEMPAPATVKGVAAAMLERLGDPLAHNGTLWSMNSRLIKLVIACQVELAALDDFHHLIDRETDRILETVSEWLKVLIKETGVPFLVAGIEGRVERILEANAQLSRLFAVRETLNPFDWDGAASRQEFAQFVRYAQDAVEMPLTKALPLTELLYRLFYASEGVVGNLMNLVRYAAMLAQEAGRDEIDIQMLALSFNKRLARHLKRKVNPFEESADRRFAAPDPAPGDDQSTNGKRTGRRKKRGPSVGETLTTK